MSRYRRVDPRIWNDEKVTVLTAQEKLAWMYLLTSPLMTPMGAGCVNTSIISDLVWCEKDADHTYGDTILRTFSDRSMILWDEPLIIIKNFLVYNTPENSNTLVSWISSCEELPKSPLFTELKNHLTTIRPALPEWLFLGLINPLSNQEVRGLHSLYWDRVKTIVNKPSSKHLTRPFTEPSSERMAIPSSERYPNPGTGTGTGTGTGIKRDMAKNRGGKDTPPRPAPPKAQYCRYVFLTDGEHTRLVERLGTQKTNDMIERLDSYIGQIGVAKARKYKSHYDTILNWHRKDADSVKTATTTMTNPAVSASSAGILSWAQRERERLNKEAEMAS